MDTNDSPPLLGKPFLSFLRQMHGSIRLDTVPPHRGRQSGADREVHMADRQAWQRSTLMRRALDRRAARLIAVVLGVAGRRRATGRPTVPPDHPALVGLVGSVVDGGAAVAAGPTPSQLGVEVLQHLGRDLAEGTSPSAGLMCFRV